MPQLFANNAVSTLAADITLNQTSLTLATGTGAKFPSPTGGDYFLLTLVGFTAGKESSWEIVRVTARTTDVLTIIRAQEGTAAQEWGIDTPVSLRVTASQISGFETARNYGNHATAGYLLATQQAVDSARLGNVLAADFVQSSTVENIAVANAGSSVVLDGIDKIEVRQTPPPGGTPATTLTIVVV